MDPLQSLSPQKNPAVFLIILTGIVLGSLRGFFGKFPTADMCQSKCDHIIDAAHLTNQKLANTEVIGLLNSFSESVKLPFFLGLLILVVVLVVCAFFHDCWFRNLDKMKKEHNEIENELRNEKDERLRISRRLEVVRTQIKDPITNCSPDNFQAPTSIYNTPPQ